MTSETNLQLIETLIDALRSEELEELEERIRNRKNQVCRLSSLPAELRNRIYDFVILNEYPAQDHGPSYTQKAPELLLACRQMRVEFSSIYYSERIWHAEVLMLDEHNRDWKNVEDHAQLRQIVLATLAENTAAHQIRPKEVSVFNANGILALRGIVCNPFKGRVGDKALKGCVDYSREIVERRYSESDGVLAGFLISPLACCVHTFALTKRKQWKYAIALQDTAM